MSNSPAVHYEAGIQGDTSSLQPVAEHIVAFVRQLHVSNEPIDTEALDKQLLGESVVGYEQSIDRGVGFSALEARYPHERPWRGTDEIVWTPYGHARTMLQSLKLGDKDVLYDLGSGYGRVPLYAGIVSTAACRGIELIAERADKASQAAARLGLDNVAIRTGNVLDHDFSDGTVFYMWEPFSEPTFEEVMRRLGAVAYSRAQAKQPPITIVTRGTSQHVLMQPWLHSKEKLPVSVSVAAGIRPYQHYLNVYQSSSVSPHK